jgi:hypothetical protein
VVNKTQVDDALRLLAESLAEALHP